MYLKGLISKLYKEFNSKNQITQNGKTQKNHFAENSKNQISQLKMDKKFE